MRRNLLVGFGLLLCGCGARAHDQVRVDDGAHLAQGGTGAAGVAETAGAQAAVEDAGTAGPADGAAADAAAGGDGEAGVQRPDLVRVTEPVSVLCAETGYVPVSAADLDGDGALERVAALRTGNGYELSVRALPGFETKWSAWRQADYVEVGVPRRAGKIAGDLWLHVGVVTDAATSTWKFTVERWTGTALDPIFETGGSGRPNLRIDADGDGAVDPIQYDGDKLAVWLGGARKPIDIEASPDQFHGVAAPFGLEQAADLDGDGDRDLIADAMDGLHIVELPGFESVWHKRSQGTISAVVPWAGRSVIAAHLDVLTQGRVTLFAPDAAHTVLADFVRPDVYAEVLDGVDPAGDGSLLALHLARTSGLLSVDAGSTWEELPWEFGGSGDPAVPRMRPVRFLGGTTDELLAVRVLSMGSPAIGGTGETVYDLVLVPPPGRGPERVIRHAEVHGEGWITAQVIDLEGDGEHEILVEESSSYAFCNIMDGGGNVSTWRLLRGDGTVLWQDEARDSSFGPDYRRDEQADAVLVELTPEGVSGLRVRTDTQEWWVLPASYSATPPPCLE